MTEKTDRILPVRVAGLVLDQQLKSPAVLLQEEQGERVLPIFIGPAEAQAIAMALQGEPSPRPMTLELMKTIIEGLQGRVVRVIVSGLEENTFLASLLIEQQGRTIVFDARPSDSIGLALRAKVPIFVSEAVMAAAGQVMVLDEEAKLKELKEQLRSINPEELGEYKLPE